MAITLSTTGYCEATEVNALLQQFTIDTNSDPSTSEVEAWITQDFSEINAILRASGYAAPVAQAGGSLAASGGTIVTKEAVTISSTAMTLQGSGATLTGAAKRGDFFTVGSDAQRYMVLEDRYVSGGEVTIEFVPPLEEEVSSGATVTYTAVSDAPAVLKKLNASMTAIRVIYAAYSASADEAQTFAEPLERERDRLVEKIEKGQYEFPTAAIPSPGVMGTVKLVRC